MGTLCPLHIFLSNTQSGIVYLFSIFDKKIIDVLKVW